MKATSKAEILKALGDSFDYGTALIDQQTDQSILQTVKTLFHVGTRDPLEGVLPAHRPRVGQLRADGRISAPEWHHTPASQRP